MNERYIKWYTPWLNREFEMLVFGNGGGLPLILFPTSFGRYYQNKDFGLVGSMSGYVEAGRVTVYCPDAIDLESFYNKSIHPADRMRTHNAYENVIVRDVFDLARRECNSHPVAVCGASLGAYHAANIAFRHPDAVSRLISLSGSFDISSFFDGYHDDNIYFNSPYEYLPNVPDPWKYNHMGIILGTGEWDNTRHESYRLSEILNSKGVKHWLDEGKWRGHDWNYWRDMLPHYLSVL
ncbi:MAG TPA: alpha/beta fold hydrolase [Candidatus Udaeobacter sp.]|nr:MAG: esterase [Verrucomicrobiota bacterium]PYL35304.1 MAG: esterase [Verrucomicrobiota bacterium]HMC25780.1 alpha/beta fold hydrolase [Candidatus Udaeobacter sp.]